MIGFERSLRLSIIKIKDLFSRMTEIQIILKQPDN